MATRDIAIGLVAVAIVLGLIAQFAPLYGHELEADGDIVFALEAKLWGLTVTFLDAEEGNSWFDVSKNCEDECEGLGWILAAAPFMTGALVIGGVSVAMPYIRKEATTRPLAAQFVLAGLAGLYGAISYTIGMAIAGTGSFSPGSAEGAGFARFGIYLAYLSGILFLLGGVVMWRDRPRYDPRATTQAE